MVGVAVGSVLVGVGVGDAVVVGLGVGPGVKVTVGVGDGVIVGEAVGPSVTVGVGEAVGEGVIVGLGRGGYTSEVICKVAPATSCADEPSGMTLLTHIGHISPSPETFGLFRSVPIDIGEVPGARKKVTLLGKVKPSVASGTVLIGVPLANLDELTVTPMVFVLVINFWNLLPLAPVKLTCKVRSATSSPTVLQTTPPRIDCPTISVSALS